MRKNYFEILDEIDLDVTLELQKLHGLIREPFWSTEIGRSCSLYELISISFRNYTRRKHFLELDEFLNKWSEKTNILSEQERYFCYAELYLDLFSVLMPSYDDNIKHKTMVVLDQIKIVINTYGYFLKHINDRLIIVEDNVFANEAAQAVSEFADVKEALSILEYNHFSNKGNIDRKKEILIKIASLLEPWREDLNNNIAFKDVLKLGNNNKVLALEKLHQMFNKLNIRHNNGDQQLSDMDDNTVEGWYDKVYTLSLFVILGKDVAQILADFRGLTE